MLTRPPAAIDAATWREYLAFCAMPSDAIVPADIQRNAAWLVDACARRALDARLLANGDVPMVYAAWPRVRTELPTILFYAHFDAQPVVAEAWSQPDPWTPVLKERALDGTWRTIPAERLFDAQPDPEWRVFGRAAADDKGPIVMLLAALDALRSAGAEPCVNVKILLDSEEEQGSPSIAGVLARERALLAADAMVVNDGPMHASRRPTLVYGNRGVVTATLTVWGPARALHSGHYGNAVANPAERLAALIASLKDEDGRVRIPGYYDGVAIDGDARAMLDAVPDDEDVLTRELGVASLQRGVGATLQDALQYPSLNVRGLAAGATGRRAATIVPDRAVAEFDLRTIPEIEPERAPALIRDWLAAHGYLVLDRPPTDAERAAHERIATWTVRPGGVAARTAPGAAVGRWVRAALRDAFGGEPVAIRTMGGTVPTGEIAAQLGVPFAILPLANADDNQHTHDENLRVGNMLDGVRALVTLLTTPYPGYGRCASTSSA